MLHRSPILKGMGDSSAGSVVSLKKVIEDPGIFQFWLDIRFLFNNGKLMSMGTVE